ncbi:hypothetical protein BGW36DRAFT_382653 [Talaromyces proteolyticus]|uniref:HTH cro/C1-type domain-containing protein n=1 Tax=Talaromyces proteolyticus TaxID=1131652 RepID=A0AAD4PYQ6_9EURO|nr:uncharacterized protein BGW36DRAFT_382653 [Talaromyces proteolyticus]KAH8695413.1 hypothetical protein BGW36DRAFT_382653 [Talaromyces proteolyticus]
MSSQPQCPAVKAAMDRSGYSFGNIAEKMGTSENHIKKICTGTEDPTAAEFSLLAGVLDITEPLPTSHNVARKRASSDIEQPEL